MACAFAAHLLLLAALAWTPRHTPIAGTPAMQVILAPFPWTADRRPLKRASRARAPRVDDGEQTPTASIQPPSLAPPSPVEAQPPAPEPSLRGLFGCSPSTLHRLSREARAACEERAGAQARFADQRGPPVDLDPKGAFARDATPYLNRRPRNGCKVGAGGSEGGLGQQGAAAGVNCAWSF